MTVCKTASCIGFMRWGRSKNANKIDFSLFAPANSIASLLANQFAEADGLQVSALMYAALVLFILTLTVNVFAELIVVRVKRI